MSVVRLGLIGDNIARSQSPVLHVEAGCLCGLNVTYERIIPPDLGIDFDAAFERCRSAGFRGINVTYPYKEAVVRRVAVEDPLTAQIGACNTVLFDPDIPRGHNTDHSGFVGAFRQSFPQARPGIVAMVGAGGVGKAIAFALERLGAEELRLFDTDRRRASSLAASIEAAGAAMRVVVCADAAAAADRADGLVNCTPLGMVGHPGSAIPGDLMATARWAFDAVYTPVDTQFLTEARARGISIMSGYELFFHQGVDAFRLFTGCEVDQGALRAALARRQEDEAA